MYTQVNDQDLELLSQWVDGELNDVEGRRLQQRLSNEPELRAAYDAINELNESVRQAMCARTSVPLAISERLATTDGVAEPAFGGAGNVVRFPGGAAKLTPSSSWRWPAAIAASLVAALGIALITQNAGQYGNGLPGNDALVSATLDTLSSGSGWHTLSDGREIQSVLSFAHRDGNWCREFLLRTDQSDWRAVACRNGNGWETQAAGLESYLDSANAYRPAGASDTATVSVFINEYAADIALGPDEELAVIATGWADQK